MIKIIGQSEDHTFHQTSRLMITPIYLASAAGPLPALKWHSCQLTHTTSTRNSVLNKSAATSSGQRLQNQNQRVAASCSSALPSSAAHHGSPCPCAAFCGHSCEQLPRMRRTVLSCRSVTGSQPAPTKAASTARHSSSASHCTTKPANHPRWVPGTLQLPEACARVAHTAVHIWHVWRRLRCLRILGWRRGCLSICHLDVSAQVCVVI